MAKYDYEMSAMCNGVGHQLELFDFLFGVSPGHLVLRLADNLSVALQQKSPSAADGQRTAAGTVQALGKLQCHTGFDKVWAGALEKTVLC